MLQPPVLRSLRRRDRARVRHHLVGDAQDEVVRIRHLPLGVERRPKRVSSIDNSGAWSMWNTPIRAFSTASVSSNRCRYDVWSGRCSLVALQPVAIGEPACRITNIFGRYHGRGNLETTAARPGRICPNRAARFMTRIRRLMDFSLNVLVFGSPGCSRHFHRHHRAAVIDTAQAAVFDAAVT